MPDGFEPSEDLQIATKSYVDSNSGGGGGLTFPYPEVETLAEVEAPAAGDLVSWAGQLTISKPDESPFGVQNYRWVMRCLDPAMVFGPYTAAMWTHVDGAATPLGAPTPPSNVIDVGDGTQAGQLVFSLPPVGSDDYFAAWEYTLSVEGMSNAVGKLAATGGYFVTAGDPLSTPALCITTSEPSSTVIGKSYSGEFQSYGSGLGFPYPTDKLTFAYSGAYLTSHFMRIKPNGVAVIVA